MEQTRNAVIILIAALAVTSPASAQIPARLAAPTSWAELTRGQDLSPAVVLARVCVKEAGFNAGTTGDCAAIRAVLHRVGRADVVRGARWYSPKTFNPERLGNRPWIAYLNRQGERPRMWPANMDWRVYRERWLALVAQAEEWIVQNHEPPCDPDHWGDRHRDHERAVAAGWTLIDCGPTQNEFWQIPRRRR